ncbi:tRNA uridine-5-carboxymethylaminomethyl(34) synthesis GTPase MnmE, partial [Peptococcaceae bacterium]|nr:tRNA uridine-5-carboxymethylaminomethyl(34) synthesis GTPase MnmE [Peptococcaceae bacterium]
LHRKGLGDLEQQITALVLGGQVGISAEPLITNIRHKQALEKTKKHLETIIKDNENKIPEDLLAIDIKDSWESLGEITGTTVSEDLIDRIFKDFCIGK